MATELSYEDFLRLKWKLRGNYIIDPRTTACLVERTVGEVLLWKRAAAAFPGRIERHHLGTHYVHPNGEGMTNEEVIRMLRGHYGLRGLHSGRK